VRPRRACSPWRRSKTADAAVFDVSYRYLHPDPRRFLRCLGLHPGTTIDAYAAGALADIPLQEAGRHLDALHGEGLLIEIGYRRYGMHDLIRLYARHRAAADPATDRTRTQRCTLRPAQTTTKPAGDRVPTSKAKQPRSPKQPTAHCQLSQGSETAHPASSSNHVSVPRVTEEG